MLYKNPSLENAPCHRVVSSKMMLAPNYVFGGAEVQKNLLEKEGHKFEGNRLIIK